MFDHQLVSSMNHAVAVPPAFDLTKRLIVGLLGRMQGGSNPMRGRIALLVVWLFALAVPQNLMTLAQEKKEAPPPPPPLALKVGDTAPDFTLPDDNGNQVTLSSFKGKKNVALAFYIFAFTGG